MRAWIGVVTLIGGIIILVAGIVIITVIPQAVKDGVIKATVADSEDSSGYDDFVETSNDTLPHMRVTFWNLTNPEEILSGNGARPKYVEAGPYVYTRKTFKKDIQFLEDGDKVTYKYVNEYVFQPDESQGDPENDIIVNLNGVYFNAIAVAGGENFVALSAAAQAIGEIKEGLVSSLFLTSIFYRGSVSVIEKVFSTLLAGAGLTRSDVTNIWANAVSDPFSGYPSAFRISNSSTPSGISPSTANNLFNAGLAYSLANPNQDAWIGSLTNSSIIKSILIGVYGLTSTQADLVWTWRTTVWQPYVQTQILATFSPFGVVAPEDLGYLQWGSGLVTSGVSIQSSSGLPGIPEISIYLATIGQTIDEKYSQVAFCKSILDNYSNVTILASAVLGYQAFGVTPTGFNLLQFTQFLQYLNGDLLAIFVDPVLSGGIILAETPKNLLFGRVDAWVAKASPENSQVRGVWNDFDEAYVEANQIPEIYETGKKDVTRSTYQITYEGQSKISYYNPPADVFGFDGTFAGPKRLTEDDSVKLYYFSNDLEREVELIYSQTYTFKGITVYRYMLNYTYQTITKNAQYLVDEDYIVNLNKAGYGFDFVLTLPHFLKANKAITTDRLIGMRPDPAQHEVFLDMEPITGLGIKGSTGLQANLYVPPLVQGQGFDRWSSSITNNTYYPWYWLRIDKGIDDKLVSDFKDEVYGTLNIGNIIGALLITVGILIGILGAGFLFLAVRKNPSK